ncbi:hypothetical protein GGS23DRAFT_613942 [Durotheca rogersii]|uniref:uncharacterized protein n=1 Tax=Durotheca rogersii TaxID=419775 RepID=UPI002220DCEF|nr:uncharacterized protein GGS23DRAFT_613942 [Durotheca rogersii]KAI5860377.1 hypothetical protein GGS23DRAFT_613942 [Durotheca rogersii]
MSSPSAVRQDQSQFHGFANFPLEISYQILEDAVSTSGIHFLKLVANDYTRDALPTTSPEEEDAAATAGFTSTLQPAYAIAAADKSYYPIMNKAINQLRLVCRDMKLFVDQLRARPGNLTLDSGRLVLLQRSSDVVCIDYPGVEHSGALGAWARRLDPAQLGSIRHLAIRYSPSWERFVGEGPGGDAQSTVCRVCGRAHDSSHDSPHADGPPQHAYEFAALFPHLRTFYLLDCLAIRRVRDRSTGTCPKDDRDYRGQRFATADSARTYYEVVPECCKVATHVFAVLDWVRANYVRHCRERFPSQRRAEDVCFKVLGCEWDSATFPPLARPASEPLCEFTFTVPLPARQK